MHGMQRAPEDAGFIPDASLPYIVYAENICFSRNFTILKHCVQQFNDFTKSSDSGAALRHRRSHLKNFVRGSDPNVVNLTLRLTRKRGSYFLQIYLSKDLTKPPKSEVASRPCQSRGCSQRREPLTALQGGQSYESNQHLQKHYSIHP